MVFRKFFSFLLITARIGVRDKIQKMKKQFILILLLASSFLLYAQEKATLTKEETANYINKKMKEVGSQWITENTGAREFITGISVSIKDCDLEIRDMRKNKVPDQKINCGDWDKTTDYILNPAHIDEISEYELSASQSLGYLKIRLISSTGKIHKLQTQVVLVTNPQRYDYNRCNYSKEIENSRESCKFVYIPFLKSDPTNFNKLKKALEHLKALCKAEDDPFGE